MSKRPSLPAKPPASKPAQQRVFTPTQLQNHLEKDNSGGHIRHDPRLPKLSVKEVTEYLIATGEVARHEFDTLFRCGPRYTWGNASVYEVLRSLRPKGKF